MDRTAFAVFAAFAVSSLIAFTGYVWLSTSLIRVTEAPADVNHTVQETVR